jgi:hypothetical protein
MFIIFIAAFINLFQLYRYPEAIRMTAGRAGAELDAYYTALGIANYNFISSTPFLFPVLIWYYKFGNLKKNGKRFLLLGMLILFFSLYKSSITVPILLSVIGSYIAFTGQKNVRKSIQVSAFVMVLFLFIPRTFIASTFFDISYYIGNRNVSQRIFELGIAMEEGIDADDPNTGIEHRAQRLPENLKKFAENPIFGKGVEGNAHLFWFNYLAQFGLLGTFFLGLILFKQVKMNLLLYSKDFIFFYMLSFFLAIFFGMLKSYPKNMFFELILFIVPGIYFLKNEKNINHI